MLNEVLGKDDDKISNDDAVVWYTQSDRMRADIYTKSFTDAAKWKHATRMIGMSTMEEVGGLMEEMMNYFKSEPDLPKEPKVKDDPDQEPGDPTPKPKAKSKPKPKPKTQGKPRAVAAPSVPFRSKTSRCLMISALVGLLGGEGGE